VQFGGNGADQREKKQKDKKYVPHGFIS